MSAVSQPPHQAMGCEMGEACSLPCRTQGQARVAGWGLQQESHIIRSEIYKHPSGCQEEKRLDGNPLNLREGYVV